MAIELKVPNLGMDMEEADIVRWLVQEGDEVEKGDPVLEIDTDKTSYEVEAPRRRRHPKPARRRGRDHPGRCEARLHRGSRRGGSRSRKALEGEEW